MAVRVCRGEHRGAQRQAYGPIPTATAGTCCTRTDDRTPGRQTGQAAVPSPGASPARRETGHHETGFCSSGGYARHHGHPLRTVPCASPIPHRTQKALFPAVVAYPRSARPSVPWTSAAAGCSGPSPRYSPPHGLRTSAASASDNNRAHPPAQENVGHVDASAAPAFQIALRLNFF